MQPAFDHLERICAAILVDAAQPEPEDGDDADPKPRVIRPTGRAHRARQPYTITPAARQTNWFAKSLEFDNHDFQDFYRMSKQTSWLIVALIRSHEIYISRGRRKQHPVHQQLGVIAVQI